MTLGQYCNRYEKGFFKYGILAEYYGLIGHIFKSKPYLDKSVEYLNKRWNIMMRVMKEQK